MSVDVRQQLDRLAQDAPVGVPPSDLWQRGVRRRRRRLAGGVAASVLAVLAGGGLAGTVVVTAPPPTVAPTDGDGAAIPDRFVLPDAWTPGTDRKGPPGRLAVVAGAPRRSGILGTERNGLVGIGAASGTYRFLDLPGRLPDDAGLISADEPLALSPDGRRLAYWLGDTTASGVAVYDTVTGSVRRTSFPSPRGLAPGTLVWASADALLVRYAVITQLAKDSMASTLGPLWLLTPSTGGQDRLAVRGRTLIDRPTAMPGGFSGWDGQTLAMWSRVGATYDERRVAVTGTGRTTGVGTSVVGPGRSRVAVVVPPNAGPGRLYVATIASATTSAQARRVHTRVAVQTVLGWRDPAHVLVDGGIGRERGVYAVDVVTGASERVVDLPEQSYTPGQVYASDLWAMPTVARPDPADVLDPRLPASGGGALVLLMLLVVRRARRRRGLR